MRILVTTQFFYPHPGGSQEVIRQLYSTLVKNHKNIQVDLVCYNTDGAKKHEIVDGINVYRVGCKQILPGQFALPNYLELASLVLRLKKENKYDIVNSHTRFFDNSWWSPFVARYLGTKSILTDHCASSAVHSNKFITFLARLLDFVLIPIVTRLYDKVVVVSKATKIYLESMGGKKVDMVVSNAVHTDSFYKSKAKKDKIIVTFIGRMISSKRPQLLLEAAESFRKDKVEFIFAGDGPLLGNLKSKSLANTKFLGRLEKKEVIKLLAKTDIFVHPSVHHEGMPIALLEAAAAGCCIVATNKGGTKELIKDKVTGLIVKPNSEDITHKIRSLISNPKLTQTLGEKARHKAQENFDWARTGEKYYRFLHKCH